MRARVPVWFVGCCSHNESLSNALESSDGSRKEEEGVVELQETDLSLNPNSTTDLLCDLEQLKSLFKLSGPLFPSLQNGDTRIILLGPSWGI